MAKKFSLDEWWGGDGSPLNMYGIIVQCKLVEIIPFKYNISKSTLFDQNHGQDEFFNQKFARIRVSHIENRDKCVFWRKIN
jgi:hypothetical protein